MYVRRCLVPERLCGGFVYLGRYNKCSPLPFLAFSIAAVWIRVLNRPEFSGHHDFQAEKFGRQCAKSGSHAVGLQENSSKKLT